MFDSQTLLHNAPPPTPNSDVFVMDFQSHAYDLASYKEISREMCDMISNVQRGNR